MVPAIMNGRKGKLLGTMLCCYLDATKVHKLIKTRQLNYCIYESWSNNYKKSRFNILHMLRADVA